MSSYDYDLFVIGAGSGGVRASRMCAAQGARVAVAENRYLGGTCVNVGCVPKKLFVYGSHFAEEFSDASGFGWSASAPTFDWPTLRDNKNVEISRLNGIYGNLLGNAGVETLTGTAVVQDAHTVAVDGKAVTAERILVATGSWPVVPDWPGLCDGDAFFWRSHLEQFPKRPLVIGGGYIAVEFAGIFAGLGAAPTLAYRGDMFLRGFDQGIREFVRDEMEKKHVNLRFNTDIERIEKNGDDLRVHFKDGSHIDSDLVLAATGRKPLTEGIGLENAGVELAANGAVIVDDYFQTNVENIYAIGDVIDRMQLTPVAIAEAMCLTKTLYMNEPTKLDYDFIPTAVFCQPNIGTVGLTEEQARADFGDDLAFYESRFRPMKHTLSGRDEQTMMKLIVQVSTDRVIGAHMAGADAGEIAQGLAVAMKAGATKAIFDQTIGIHPTTAEEFVTMREVRAG